MYKHLILIIQKNLKKGFFIHPIHECNIKTLAENQIVCVQPSQSLT